VVTFSAVSGKWNVVYTMPGIPVQPVIGLSDPWKELVRALGVDPTSI
jgi:hypothetical protein